MAHGNRTDRKLRCGPQRLPPSRVFIVGLQDVPRQLTAAVSRAFAVTLVAAFVLLSAAAGARAQPPSVSVYPSPNTASALPQTQITFRGIPASQIGAVQVVGSSSGAHSGTIRADSDGQGGSLILSQPFAAGETVTVTTGLNVVGGSSGSFHFAIASPFGTIDPQKLPVVPAGANGVQHFHTRPDLESPRSRSTGTPDRPTAATSS